MAKSKHSHSRKNRSHKRMRGGVRVHPVETVARAYAQTHKGGGEPASAWGWGLGTVGDGWTQYMNSLSLQPGQGAVAANQNTLVPINRANSQKPISGGKRRRRSAKRGGNIGAVLSQAAVPGALIVMNNALGKRSRRRHHRRR